ncbi:MAG: 16S rRNA (adenine(1518)-N(6)/adenine(1519)-N(6))-dimethyltransferase RsmA [Gammaproteobacteria bacterium]|jgi:16S rRNA (adenine1518-N6/adenine1519-N6)-dimethyltransferase|nr:16S rRNA (adenine(1518)-N(6)/adenine(1519)-N(6))-dimethyltransferase RsmA [Gammaproteobacteria bacterium]MDH3848357.1 16S rRNA (adenine(1518)-N(6)/adenine(1519)-N(6))-dimethyltransferase RsmA [Gammaproteobacteria bacterium]MDH3905640.1 16S rRNA (adenine(1518)-N(6)/adenine(1519)-N(6))-dimethyltransferase RsmA [Gammaproteobacteria bacterium]NCF60220.1 16S rRNA (adenine(1518)-N(6)/adenine(1519)-N(6))-dimethyltransferase RsmA [Gammaproteobacteria bacterium]
MNAHRPRKRFGQHFLSDPGVIDAIVRAIDPRPGDTIVEIGPGHGAITEPLAKKAGKLHCVELDRDLAAALRHRFSGSANVTVHEADALKFDFCALGDSLRIVGNLPYNISTPLLFHLIGSRDCIADMYFMLQKEVVDRMTAAPGNKTYGRLGIMLGCHLGVEALFDVGPQCFDPPPAVTSAVVRLAPLGCDRPAIDDEKLLGRLVATAFSQRRKTVRNALKSLLDETELRSLGVDPGKRPESLTIPDYVSLANYVSRRDGDSG